MGHYFDDLNRVNAGLDGKQKFVQGWLARSLRAARKNYAETFIQHVFENAQIKLLSRCDVLPSSARIAFSVGLPTDETMRQVIPKLLGFQHWTSEAAIADANQYLAKNGLG